jgi:hypothetical protein
MTVDKALNILQSAVDRCRVHDVRTPGVYDALTFLEGCSAVKRPFDQFRSAQQSRYMTRQDKEALWQALNASCLGG